MDDGLGVNFNKVYNGTLTFAEITDLTPGIKYTFFVTATNHNGEGLRSDLVSYRACAAPSSVLAPELVLSTSTTALLKWRLP
jgi:hypothetical protein